MKAWNYLIVYLTCSDLCERGDILSQKQTFLSPFQVSREVQDMKLTWQDVLIVNLQVIIGSVLLLSRIWSLGRWGMDPSLPLPSTNALSLRTGQHWCWRGDPCIHFVLLLWERSRISNRNLQKLGDEGTRCSEEGAWCFPCLTLWCECSVWLETGEA